MAILLLFLAIMIDCQKSNPNFPTTKIIQQLNPKLKDFRVIKKYRSNIAPDPSLESVLIIRTQTEEILQTYHKKQKHWQKLSEIRVKQINRQSYLYNQSERVWQETKSNKGLYAISKIMFINLPGDTFSSILIEKLEKKNGVLMAIPYVYRSGQKIFDGNKSLNNHPILKRDKTTNLSYIKEDKAIRIFPQNPTYRQDLLFNGWELVASASGMSAISLLEKKIIKNGDKYQLEFVFKNRGSHARNTYLSFYFPQQISATFPKNSKGFRFYRNGAKVFLQSQKYGNLTGYLIEYTKESWLRNHRHKIIFEVKSSQPIQTIFFRYSNKISREIISIPNEYSSIPTTIDGQGFSVYPITLQP